MKKQFYIRIIKSILILTFTGFIFTSCEQEGSNIEEESLSQEIENAYTQTEIENVSEGVNDIIENVYFDIDDYESLKSSDTKDTDEQKFLPDCLTITKVITDSKKIITLDYGDGCTTRNDNYLSGIIIAEFNFNFDDGKVVIDYTFDNFYFNYKKVEGQVHKVRTRKNENGNPQAIINSDLKITWEDESFVTIKGERKREWIEGLGNYFWSDNVFLVTGTWTITKKDGTIRTAKVIEPLRREMACKFLVSGIVEIQKNDVAFTLNYGDGECDDLGIVTIDNKEYEIHLRQRRKN